MIPNAWRVYLHLVAALLLTASCGGGESNRTGSDANLFDGSAAPIDASGSDGSAAPTDANGSDGSAAPTDASTTTPDANGTPAPDADPTATASLDDSFEGSGPLVGYVTNNPTALPDVARVDGRYRANLVDNTGNVTLHYHAAQGRLDAKLIAFPFEVIVRNIGIGIQSNSQTAPPTTGDPYLFAGVQVHVPELESRNSTHVVVGHRGGAHFTVEGKNTVDGVSSVNDDGYNAAPAGRADLRIVGNVDRTLTVYWQTPNPAPGSTADDWRPYRGTGTLPGPAPAYGPTVYVGLITYAYGTTGIPFVGTCDSIEQL